LTNSFPEKGESVGGYSISIVGLNIPQPFGNTAISCKFGMILCKKVKLIQIFNSFKSCVWVSSTSVICEVVSHPPGNALVSISYNGVDWHSIQKPFLFSTCAAGYTASSYNQLCTLCPPGTYKPSAGLFDCIKCGVDTYSSFAGSVFCERCQENSTTNGVVAASSFSQCICKPNYFTNPLYAQQSSSHQKCIACPTGSICPEYNMTIPFAKYGYWRSSEDFVTYYQCIPEESCGGGGPLNCSTINFF
jgi:hypothetical protein